jgi:hypothetical protein
MNQKAIAGWARGAILIFGCLALGSKAVAHEIRPAIATVDFTSNAQYTVEISVNLEAVIAGISPVHQDTSESPNAKRYDTLRKLSPLDLQKEFKAFEARYVQGVVLEWDGVRATPTSVQAQIAEVGDAAQARISRVLIQGAIPPGARELRWQYDKEFGDSIVRFPAVNADTALSALYLKNGVMSDPYVLGEGLKQKTRFDVMAQYTAIGFTHILPYGLDHILFVLGLFLLSVKFKPLLWQVTAFTVAHSITLGLAMAGLVELSPSIVEPLIAASIVYVAVENILTTVLHAWRVALVFGFGLLHGLGFAGVLQEVGLPTGEFVTGLVMFNVGVELGQLAVIGLAFLLVGWWFRDKPWYRARVVVPASVAIALVGAYWTVERVFF